jgi:hypothetical protein
MRAGSSAGAEHKAVPMGVAATVFKVFFQKKIALIFPN